jgi:hypothetical protein
MGLWIIFGFLLLWTVYKMLRPSVNISTMLEQQTKARECGLEHVKKLFSKGGPKACLFIYAEWCGHCQKCKQPYDEVAAEFSAKGIEICKVNGGDEKNKDIIHYLTQDKSGPGLQIQGFPFFVCVAGGEQLSKQVGAFPSDNSGSMPGLASFIEKSF